MISRVQAIQGNSGASYVNSLVIQWGSNTTTGNFLFLAIATIHGVSTVTDDQGNTWTKLDSIAGTGSLKLDIWYCKNCTGGTTPNVTITLGASVFDTISAIGGEYNPVDKTSPIDVRTDTVESNYVSSHPTGNTATTNQANEMNLAAYAYTNNGVTLTETSGGYSTVLNQSNSTQYTGLAFTDKAISSTGAQHATFDSGSHFLEGISYIVTIKQGTVTNTETFTTDGIIKATTTATFTVDGQIISGSHKTFTTDGIIKATTTATFTVDAIIVDPNAGTSTGIKIKEIMITTPTGTISGDASYVSSPPLSYIQLTPASNNKKGALEYIGDTPTSFEFQTILWANGAAEASFMYWGNNQTPTSEDDAHGGYIVAFDEAADQVQLFFNGVSLTTVAQPFDLAGSQKYLAKVVVSGLNIKVYINSVLQIDYTDISRTLAGNKFGAGARTSSSNAEHRLYAFVFLNNPDERQTVARGVALSGLEFGTSIPGALNIDYYNSSQDTYNYFGNKTFTFARLPFLWERLQPDINGELDATYKGYLDGEIAKAKAAGIQIILDCHNYGRRTIYGSGGITENFTEASPSLEYPYADYTANGHIVLRDFGLSLLGTFDNPVAPATGYKVSFNMKFNSKDTTFGSEGLYVRPMWTDANNYYEVGFDYADQTYTVKKVVNGVSTTLGSGSHAWVLGTTYAIVIDVNQTTNGKINTTVGGVALYTNNSISTDAALAKGKVGFYALGVHVQLDTMVLNVNGDTTSGGNNSYIVGTTNVPYSAFSDLWSRIAQAYKDNTTVYGYDLMNEPHDMTVPTTTSNYLTTATVTNMMQQAINAIRVYDHLHWILTNLDSYAGAQSFVGQYGTDPTPWLTDSFNLLIYSVHYYFDNDHSGTYANAFASSNNNNILADVMSFFAWGKEHNIPTHVGEYGVPNTSSWQVCLTTFLDLCNMYDVAANHWAAGDHYSSITTLQPTGSAPNLTDLLQMATIGMQRYLGAGFLPNPPLTVFGNLPGFILDGKKLKNPKTFLREPIFEKVDFTMLTGKTTRDISHLKEKFTLGFVNLTKQQVDDLNSIIDKQVPVTLSINGKNQIVVQTTVFPYIGAIVYDVVGSDYRASTTLELIEET